MFGFFYSLNNVEFKQALFTHMVVFLFFCFLITHANNIKAPIYPLLSEQKQHVTGKGSTTPTTTDQHTQRQSNAWTDKDVERCPGTRKQSCWSGSNRRCAETPATCGGRRTTSFERQVPDCGLHQRNMSQEALNRHKLEKQLVQRVNLCQKLL